MTVEKEIRFRVDRKTKDKIILSTGSLQDKAAMLDITFGRDGFNSLSKNGYICRIRQKPQKLTLEVKKKIPTGWLEQEIPLSRLSDGINYLQLMGMKPYMYLQRNREVRRYKNLKVFIDEIDVLGDFVEIEYQDSKDAVAELNEFLALANLNFASTEDLYGNIIMNSIKANPAFRAAYNKGLTHTIDTYVK
ncbi:MAG: CYTH domain-containing protein [Clostridia bacterium]|nr:CYTH domain-containing protein [Clostridia bacterium]